MHKSELEELIYFAITLGLNHDLEAHQISSVIVKILIENHLISLPS